MFKKVPLLCLFFLSSLHGMNLVKRIDAPHAIKQFIFWYINTTPVYQGLVETAEILDECTISSTLPAEERMVKYIKTELKELNLPETDIQVRKQTYYGWL